MEHPNETEDIAIAFNKSNLNNTENLYINTFEIPYGLDNNAKASNNNATFDNFKDKWKKVQINRLSTKVGFLFASKPVVQLITNPFIGPLTNRYISCY